MRSATAGGWGQWWLAAVLIVIASWLLYRYVAPKSWREWGGAGLVRFKYCAYQGRVPKFFPRVSDLTQLFRAGNRALSEDSK